MKSKVVKSGKRRNMKSEPMPDSIHGYILNNFEANKLADEAAIRLAMEKGMSREEAKRLYGGEYNATVLDGESDRVEKKKQKKGTRKLK